MSILVVTATLLFIPLVSRNTPSPSLTSELKQITLIHTGNEDSLFYVSLSTCRLFNSMSRVQHHLMKRTREN